MYLGRTIRWIAPTLLSAACLTFASESEAQASRILRPSTRAAWYAAGIGPAFNASGPRFFRGGFGTDFVFANEIGYHFSGDGTGPAIGGSLELQGNSGYFRATPGFNFWWDIPVTSRYAIYITPGAQVGGAFTTSGFGHYFNTQLSTAGRLVLADRAILFFQPFTMDLIANGNGVFVNHQVLVGGGVTFP